MNYKFSTFLKPFNISSLALFSSCLRFDVDFTTCITESEFISTNMWKKLISQRTGYKGDVWKHGFFSLLMSCLFYRK